MASRPWLRLLRLAIWGSNLALLGCDSSSTSTPAGGGAGSGTAGASGAASAVGGGAGAESLAGTGGVFAASGTGGAPASGGDSATGGNSNNSAAGSGAAGDGAAGLGPAGGGAAGSGSGAAGSGGAGVGGTGGGAAGSGAAGGAAGNGGAGADWPTCDETTAVDSKPNNGNGKLVPSGIAPLQVKRPGQSAVIKIRDLYIAPAPNETTPDGLYYLTGTTANNPDAWSSYDGIELWSSPDLKTWTYLGFVWRFSVDAKAEPNAFFAQPINYQSPTHNNNVPYPLQVVWAPEIHYLKGNWYIPFSMPGAATGLLKSTTGKPTGPYRNAIADGDGSIASRNIDPDLFQDPNGTVYYLDHKGNMAPLKPDLSGLAAPLTLQIGTAGGNPNGNVTNPAEGAFMFKAFDTYYLDITMLSTLQIDGRYSSWVATTTNDPELGPYTKITEAVPYGGHNDFFKDRKCRWWSTMFGNHSTDPVYNQPALIPVEFDSNHLIRVDFDPRP